MNLLLLTTPCRLDRDAPRHALQERNIGTGVHYTALDLPPHYARRCGRRRGDFPNAAAVSATTLSLPLSAKLTDADVGDIGAMREAVAGQTPRS